LVALVSNPAFLDPVWVFEASSNLLMTTPVFGQPVEFWGRMELLGKAPSRGEGKRGRRAA